MKTHKTLAVLAAALLAGSAAADSLPPGTLITGHVSGASTTLLGLDHGFTDEPGSNTTALAAADLEFMTGDFAVAVDFFSDGHVQVWNNSGAASLPGSYTLTFDFGAGSPAIAGFVPLDVSGLSGSVNLQVVSEHSISISFSNLGFGTEFGSFTAQLNVTAVPEPASSALLLAGLGLFAGLRGTRRAVA